SFLIDLDLAVRTDRLGASGARGKTGTLAFMAIDALRGEPHTFMADLESFFWVLFWLCTNFKGPNQPRTDYKPYDKWNYEDMDTLARIK
ncbi:hypothetical protein F5883DRAFT_368861, partial [Diaporthe sp. PMI_573]